MKAQAEKTGLQIALRKEIGSNQVKKLRRRGLLPGILYGQKEKPLAISLSREAFEEYLTKHQRIVDLNLDGQTIKAMIKDIQLDTYGEKFLHVDFHRVQLGSTLSLSVPLICQGTAQGVRHGGILEAPIKSVQVECLPSEIPQEIKVDVSHLEIGDALRLKDLPLPKGVKILDDPELTVAMVTQTRDEEGLPAEQRTEPEVIGAKKTEEDQNA